VCSRDWQWMCQLLTPRRALGPCSQADLLVSVAGRLRPTASVHWCQVTSPGRVMTSLTVSMVWMCPTMTLSTSAVCLHHLTTLAKYTQSWQWDRAETFVDRRRCLVGISRPWRWCLSVAHVLWRWTWWLLRTDHRLCRQRHLTESHQSPPGLQHTTTRSHCHLQYQSINQSTSQSPRHFCRTSPTRQCAQTDDTAVIRGFYKRFITTISETIKLMLLLPHVC